MIYGIHYVSVNHTNGRCKCVCGEWFDSWKELVEHYYESKYEGYEEFRSRYVIGMGHERGGMN